MLGIYKIHHGSDEYNVWKGQERNSWIKKIIAKNILHKIQNKDQTSILGFKKSTISVKESAVNKVYVQKQHTIERRANITTSNGD